MEFTTNPFESGHIKNYILLYVAVVVIMVLFFFASDLWIEPKKSTKKVSNSKASISNKPPQRQKKQSEAQPFTPKFELLQEGY